MRNNIEIRSAEISDIESLSRLLYQVHGVHSAARPDIFVSGAKKYSDAQLEQILADEDRPIFVAIARGTVVGYVFCVLLSNHGRASLADIETLYIDDLCVDETYRGNGAGRLLYEHAVAFAEERGCYNVTLNVWAENKNAVEFYKKLGMKIQKLGMEQIL